MSDIIVICNWDSDSSMNHPISKERLPNNGECYILLVTDKVQFMGSIKQVLPNRLLELESEDDTLQLFDIYQLKMWY